jgi:hypothetical protein
MFLTAGLVASLPFSSQAEEFRMAGTFIRAQNYLPPGGLVGQVARPEYERGAMASAQVTTSGAITLKLSFQSKQFSFTGQFEPDDREPPMSDVYFAELGSLSAGTHLSAMHDGTGIYLINRSANGFEDYFAELWPLKIPEAGARAWNTVHITPEPLAQWIVDEKMTGVGYGGLRLGRTGSAIFAGTLPDGQGVTAGGMLAQSLPLGLESVVSLMMKTASGRDTLSCLVSLEGGDEDPSASLTYGQWGKGPSRMDAFAKEGWTRWVQLQGAPYTPPAAGEKLFFQSKTDSPNATISFYGANRVFAPVYGPFLDHEFFINQAHKAVLPHPTAPGLKVHFYPPTGLFTGSFVLAEPPRRAVTVPFSGMLRRVVKTSEAYPSYTVGRGFFFIRPREGGLNVPVVSGQVEVYGLLAE